MGDGDDDDGDDDDGELAKKIEQSSMGIRRDSMSKSNLDQK